MPYIATEKRDVLNPHIDSIMNALRELESDDPNNSMCGNINYTFTRILDQCYARRYGEMNEAIGILNCVQLEYYRRVAAPYEDQKAFDNGDVYHT